MQYNHVHLVCFLALAYTTGDTPLRGAKTLPHGATPSTRGLHGIQVIEDDHGQRTSGLRTGHRLSPVVHLAGQLERYTT